MGDKLDISDGALRRRVRELLAAAGGYGIGEAVLLERVNEAIRPSEVDLGRLREAVEWNQSRGYATWRYDEDFDVDLWYLTERGRAKQNEGIK